jgi:hypothetical protein
MRFLVFAVVEAKREEDAATLTDRLGKDLSVTVKEARFLLVAEPGRRPSEFYLPCPRDTSLTRLEVIEDDGREVYFGRCRNQHQLMLSATQNSRV